MRQGYHARCSAGSSCYPAILINVVGKAVPVKENCHAAESHTFHTDKLIADGALCGRPLLSQSALGFALLGAAGFEQLT